MVERISKRPAPSLRSAAEVTERCKLKVEKKAKKASSSLFCDSDMSQTAFKLGRCPTESQLTRVYGIRQPALI